MPTTDDYGQDIQIAALTDAPDASKLARDIVNSIAPRGVMRFASSSARAAELIGSSAPVEGMVAWLQDVNRLEVYDGTSWAAVASGTSAWTTISLASGFSHNGNSNGNAEYRIVSLFGEATVMLRGGINVTYPGGTIANGSTFTSVALPVAARPTTLRTVPAACSAASSTVTSLKIDALTSGHLQVVGTDSTDKPPWVSLNNCFYSL